MNRTVGCRGVRHAESIAESMYCSMRIRFGSPVNESVSALRTNCSCVVALSRTDWTTRVITITASTHAVIVLTSVSLLLAGLSTARTMMGATRESVVVTSLVMSAGETVWGPCTATLRIEG